MREEEEPFKDIRLCLDLIVKDLRRLSDDVKCLSEFLKPLEKENNDASV